jgi:hypothetical protein
MGCDRRRNLKVRTAPGELGREPQIDPVFAAERGGAGAVLLVMMLWRQGVAGNAWRDVGGPTSENPRGGREPGRYWAAIATRQEATSIFSTFSVSAI